MSKPIRVLQVFHGMDCGGAENMIMNLYRNIDRSKVQFDFLVHTKKKCFFDDEIKNLGGRIFFVPYYNIKNTVAYKKALRHLYESHHEIKIVHGHLAMLTSKVMIDSSYHTIKMKPTKKQLFIQCWHGSPLKYMHPANDINNSE